MRIAVIGATGIVGRRGGTEALSRSHEVTAVMRNASRFNKLPAGVIPQMADDSNVDDIVKISEGQDVVISAIPPTPGNESEIIPTTQALLEGIARTGIRLLIVGGVANLTVPNSGGVAVIDDPHFIPAPWRRIAQGSFSLYQTICAEGRLDWAYLCPPATLESGNRTGHYHQGHDELIVDDNGNSTISIEDLAAVEYPRIHQTMFSAAY